MRFKSAIILLALSSSIYADDGAPQPQILCNCPHKGSLCDNVGFELSGQWLYLQPNGSNIYYAAEAFPYDTSISEPAISPNWQIFEIDPSFHSGFEVGMNFLLLNNDMNLTLDWERLHAQDTDSMNVTPLDVGKGNMVGPIVDIGPNSSNYKTATGRAMFQFDEVDLLARKSICFVKDLTLSINMGVSFTRIKQKMSSHYSNGFLVARGIDSESSYWGVGPQFGMDLSYPFGYGIYFAGSSSASLYMGRIQNHTTYESFAPQLGTLGVPQPNLQQTKVPTRSQLVPGFEERLGLGYMHSFENWSIDVGAGYLFQIYLNAVQSMDMLTQAIPNFAFESFPDMGVFALTFNRTLSNFILSGPYVSLSVSF